MTSRHWSGRIISACAALLAACASIGPAGDPLEKQVAAVLEKRALGPDALRIIDNLVRHGPAAPPAVPALVRELLARPLDALGAAAVFRRAIPGSLVDALQTRTEGAQPLERLLQSYLADLEEAQRLLRDAGARFDEEAVYRELLENIASPGSLLALAGTVDAGQLRRANERFVEATMRFARQLRAATGWPAQAQILDLPSGTIMIGTRGTDRHALLPAKGGRFAVVIDPGGDDEYRGSDLALNGFSAIIELGGDDRYAMDGPGLGAAIAGGALLLDLEGKDTYEARYFAQGAAAFGIGALLDFGGDDRYRLEAWGQGFGIGGGTGLLWDRGGDDRYLAGGVPDPFRRAGGISGAQGAGFGHRGRLAGGIGILRDDAGDDVYEAQMFAQGLGYYYGLGVLWERAGKDRYHALQYAQGNGVHQAIGVLREEAGDDRYALAAIYGQGMGLDVAFGALADDAGDDDYRAGDAAQGSATANGFGLLADRTGSDRFATGPGRQRWGYAEWMRGLPTVAVLLHGAGARFTPPFPGEPPLVVQPMTPLTCPAENATDALLCRLRGAPDDELIRHASCSMRALALRAWPSPAAAEAALRSECFRLQAAGAAAMQRLGAAVPADAALPSFLRALPPQDDTY